MFDHLFRWDVNFTPRGKKTARFRSRVKELLFHVDRLALDSQAKGPLSHHVHDRPAQGQVRERTATSINYHSHLRWLSWSHAAPLYRSNIGYEGFGAIGQRWRDLAHCCHRILSSLSPPSLAYATRLPAAATKLVGGASACLAVRPCWP